ncbi:phenylacetate--CoA ligase family protein [Thermoactinospora rubra]|uniref:phenylacetate--CoA ligase family protein n=1 Tax=Thermoactinospora rubra TaxID=1088767 RepID=UPI000A113D0D|nr:AMP-binding protein [Thermoactinospora rubra]
MPSAEEVFAREHAAARERFYGGAMTAADWDRWRRARLAAVLRHVTERSPFYRKHLAGIDVGGITPDTLAALPYTTKEHLRDAQYDVLAGEVAEARIFYETNGTTGPPTPCPRGARDILASNSAVEESWRRFLAARFGTRRPVVGLMGPSELYAFGDVFTAVTGVLDLCHVKIWPESPRVGFAKALRLIRDLGVEVVVCAPALCLSLAKAAQYHGYDLDELPITTFLVLGEICSPEYAANVASVWPRAEVFPILYGSQEALCVATGAVDGLLHLSELNYLVELVDPDTGELVGDHGEGELVLTMLVDGIKPLIRYRTGDLVRLRPEPPGAPMPGRIVEVAGRVNDRLRVGGALLRPVELEAAVLRDVRGCLGYQVVITSDRQGRDELTVRLELLPWADHARVEKEVATGLRELTGAATTVVIDTDLDPVTSTGAFVSWKAARIVDHRTEPDGAALVAREVAHRFSVTR